MKLCVVGIEGVPLGKRNIKDPRLDEAHGLEKADKKTYAQVDVVGEDELLNSDGILVAQARAFDLIFRDLELIETRLDRSPSAGEKVVLEKLKTHLEGEHPISTAGLSPSEVEAVSGVTFTTQRPMTVAEPAELEHLDALFVRAFLESGYISYFTVGGKEDRAWPIHKGATAWEAAGAIHTDMQKGFIRAEVVAFEDFVAAGGETGAKRAGKQRLETKQYIMHDCDVVSFRFSR